MVASGLAKLERRYPVDHPGQTDHVICLGTDWEEGK